MVEASSKVLQMLEQQLICSICLDVYINPKALPCLHSFCQLCMEGIAHGKLELVVTCPTCRSHFPVPEDGIQGFPTAFYINSLKESFSLLKSDYHKDTSLTCNKCKTGEALEFCQNCNQTLCAQCIVLHKERFNTSNHAIIRLVDVTADYRTSCPIHGRRLVIYCETCKLPNLICYECIVFHHKEHEYCLFPNSTSQDDFQLFSISQKIKAFLKAIPENYVAATRLYIIDDELKGNKPQLMNWERFGLRIRLSERNILSSYTQIAVIVLVGGQFVFPENTTLVSAVYAIFTSGPLRKPLRLEMQHCIDLQPKPSMNSFLMFAVAPIDMSSTSKCYQFRRAKGGIFPIDGQYGSFQECTDLSLVCTLGEESCDEISLPLCDGDLGGSSGVQHDDSTAGVSKGCSPDSPEKGSNGDRRGNDVEGECSDGGGGDKGGGSSDGNGAGGSDKQSQKNEEGEKKGGNTDENSGGNGEGGGSQGGEGGHGGGGGGGGGRGGGGGGGGEGGGGGGGGGGEGSGSDEEEEDREESSEDEDQETLGLRMPQNCTEPSPDDIPVISGIRRHTKHTGLLYYKDKKEKDLLTFTATKDLNALLEHINSRYAESETYQSFHFTLIPIFPGRIELKFDAEQKAPITGWTICPRIYPCQIYRTEIDNFGHGCNSFPPERMISLIASNNPDTVPTVIYDVPVEGIVEQPLTLRIIGKLKNIPGNTVESNVSISQNTSLEPPNPRQQPRLPQQIDSATANEAFREHFSDMSNLMSIRSNRINFATMLYTEKVIPFECFRNAIEGETADAEKATSLLITLTQLIQADHEVLVTIIKKILFKKEEFKNLARKLCDAIKDE